MDENAELELEQARDALADARVLLTGDGTDAGVVNRLYYAAFHAAQAVFMTLARIRHRTAMFAGCSANASSSKARRPVKRAGFWELSTTIDVRPTTVAAGPMPM